MKCPTGILPLELKPIQAYISRAQEFMTRDPIIAYHALFYAANSVIARNLAQSDESKLYLLDIVDCLEQVKNNLKIS